MQNKRWVELPADMVFTRILFFLPASNASTWFDKEIKNAKRKNKMEGMQQRKVLDLTRVSLSSAAFAELIPPPYLTI